MHFDGTNDYISVPDDATLTLLDGNYTFGCWFRWEGSSHSFDWLAGWGSFSASPSLMLEIEESDDILRWRIEDSGGDFAFFESPSALSKNVWHLFIATGNGSIHEVWTDNSSWGTYDDSSFPIGDINVGAAFNIGSFPGGGSDWFTGDIAQLFKVDRPLSDDEIAALWNGGNPQQIIADFSSGYYLPLDINGTDLSGNANNGTVTGAAVGDMPPIGPYISQDTVGDWIASAAAITLTAAQGSYALTGQAATLSRAISVTAIQGSYTLTGQAASLLRQLKLNAIQGSYSLAGQIGLLTKQSLLSAVQGSYTLTGQAATLSRQIILTAIQGSYTLTGQTAVLTKQSNLTASQGSYTLSGQSAVLKKTVLLTAAQGSYSLTGQSAILTKQSKLLASLGTYTLTGQSATLTHSGVSAPFTYNREQRSSGTWHKSNTN